MVDVVWDDVFINDRVKSNIFQYNILLRCIFEKGREVGWERGVGGVKWIFFYVIVIFIVLFIGFLFFFFGIIYLNK